MRVLAKGGGDTRMGLADGTTPLMAVTGIGWGGEVDRRDAYVLQGTPFNDGDRAFETAKLALELGADVNATNDAGDTALHGAASKGYDAIVQELADKGAQLEVKNRRGRTPLMAAKKSTADLLRKLGAKE